MAYYKQACEYAKLHTTFTSRVGVGVGSLLVEPPTGAPAPLLVLLAAPIYTNGF